MHRTRSCLPRSVTFSNAAGWIEACPVQNSCSTVSLAFVTPPNVLLLNRLAWNERSPRRGARITGHRPQVEK
jgi:hypothetical protein